MFLWTLFLEYIEHLDKPFSYFMEHKWDEFLRKFGANHNEIFQVFECVNEEEAFEKIICKGNNGFHEFIKKLLTVVSVINTFDID